MQWADLRHSRSLVSHNRSDVEHAVGRSLSQQISSQPQQISVEHAVGSGLRRTGSMKEQLEYIMNAVDRIDAMQKCNSPLETCLE